MSLAISAAVVAAAFDLICSGTMVSRSFYSGEKTETYQWRYRIDLEKKLYCDGDCRATNVIAEVRPTQIILTNKKIDGLSEREENINFIDRQTGKHVVLSISSRPNDSKSILSLKWDGQCERAPFSGFPSFETKF